MLRLFEDVVTILKRVANQGVDKRKRELYYDMERKMKATMDLMSEQQRKFNQLANSAEDAGNVDLADTFRRMARKVGNELQEADAAKRMMRNIAN